MIRIVDLCGANHTLESPEPLLFEKNEEEAECFKNSTFYRKHLQTKLTTSNNYGNVFFWKQHEASEICPTHNFTKIQDRPTPGLILPLGHYVSLVVPSKFVE